MRYSFRFEDHRICLEQRASKIENKCSKGEINIEICPKKLKTFSGDVLKNLHICSKFIHYYYSGFLNLENIISIWDKKLFISILTRSVLSHHSPPHQNIDICKELGYIIVQYVACAFEECNFKIHLREVVKKLSILGCIKKKPSNYGICTKSKELLTNKNDILSGETLNLVIDKEIKVPKEKDINKFKVKPEDSFNNIIQEKATSINGIDDITKTNNALVQSSPMVDEPNSSSLTHTKLNLRIQDKNIEQATEIDTKGTAKFEVNLFLLDALPCILEHILKPNYPFFFKKDCDKQHIHNTILSNLKLLSTYPTQEHEGQDASEAIVRVSVGIVLLLDVLAYRTIFHSLDPQVMEEINSEVLSTLRKLVFVTEPKYFVKMINTFIINRYHQKFPKLVHKLCQFFSQPLPTQLLRKSAIAANNLNVNRDRDSNRLHSTPSKRPTKSSKFRTPSSRPFFSSARTAKLRTNNSCPGNSKWHAIKGALGISPSMGSSVGRKLLPGSLDNITLSIRHRPAHKVFGTGVATDRATSQRPDTNISSFNPQPTTFKKPQSEQPSSLLPSRNALMLTQTAGRVRRDFNVIIPSAKRLKDTPTEALGQKSEIGNNGLGGNEVFSTATRSSQIADFALSTFGLSMTSPVRQPIASLHHLSQSTPSPLKWFRSFRESDQPSSSGNHGDGWRKDTNNDRRADVDNIVRSRDGRLAEVAEGTRGCGHLGTGGINRVDGGTSTSYRYTITNDHSITCLVPRDVRGDRTTTITGRGKMTGNYNYVSPSRAPSINFGAGQRSSISASKPMPNTVRRNLFSSSTSSRPFRRYNTTLDPQTTARGEAFGGPYNDRASENDRADGLNDGNSSCGKIKPVFYRTQSCLDFLPRGSSNSHSSPLSTNNSSPRSPFYIRSANASRDLLIRTSDNLNSPNFGDGLDVDLLTPPKKFILTPSPILRTPGSARKTLVAKNVSFQASGSPSTFAVPETPIKNPDMASPSSLSASKVPLEFRSSWKAYPPRRPLTISNANLIIPSTYSNTCTQLLQKLSPAHKDGTDIYSNGIIRRVDVLDDHTVSTKSDLVIRKYKSFGSMSQQLSAIYLHDTFCHQFYPKGNSSRTSTNLSKQSLANHCTTTDNNLSHQPPLDVGAGHRISNQTDFELKEGLFDNDGDGLTKETNLIGPYSCSGDSDYFWNDTRSGAPLPTTPPQLVINFDTLTDGYDATEVFRGSSPVFLKKSSSSVIDLKVPCADDGEENLLLEEPSGEDLNPCIRGGDGGPLFYTNELNEISKSTTPAQAHQDNYCDKLHEDGPTSPVLGTSSFSASSLQTILPRTGCLTPTSETSRHPTSPIDMPNNFKPGSSDYPDQDFRGTHKSNLSPGSYRSCEIDWSSPRMSYESPEKPTLPKCSLSSRQFLMMRKRRKFCREKRFARLHSYRIVDGEDIDNPDSTRPDHPIKLKLRLTRQ